jgi:hypothetical protein
MSGKLNYNFGYAFGIIIYLFLVFVVVFGNVNAAFSVALQVFIPIQMSALFIGLALTYVTFVL